MPSEEFQKNLPNILALIILIVALLLVSTKVGLVRCSSLGQGYCDVYYMALGKPSVMIVQGDTGLGDPRALSRLIEDQRGIPVRTISVDQLSAGSLKDYQIVIVERAREMSTEKLKILRDYVFNDFGRLVWVGDAGSEGSSEDMTCKTVELTVKWSQEDGTHQSQKEYEVCVGEQEANSISEMNTAKQQKLSEEAWGKISELCSDAFAGKISKIKQSNGYACTGGDYSNAFINWDNEDVFKWVIDPWDRGTYTPLGTDEEVTGIDFSKDVLGITFIADDYAVEKYSEYSESIQEIQEKLGNASQGIVACSKGETITCNLAEKTNKVKMDVQGIKNVQDDIGITLNGLVSTLGSLEQQKLAKEEDSTKVGSTKNIINNYYSSIDNIGFPEERSQGDQSITQTIISYTQNAIDAINSLRESETDVTVKSQLAQSLSSLGDKKSSLESRLTNLKLDYNDYLACSREENSDTTQKISEQLGQEFLSIISYVTPDLDESGVIEFISRSSEWTGIMNSIPNLDEEKACGSTSTEIRSGFEALRQAIALTESVPDAPEAQALADLLVSDSEHPLIQGISTNVPLRKNGESVPFILVKTNSRNAHTVSNFKVTPAYKGESQWPAITVKDPKFASHSMGTGTVVYYAFPPETDEVFINNLVDFILY